MHPEVSWANMKKLIFKTLPWKCRECMTWKRTITKPLVKSSVSRHFNTRVHMDLFFVLDGTFLMMIDEAIRWACSMNLASKSAAHIAEAVFLGWVTYFGPMLEIVFDQEGGITAEDTGILCERFGINRDLGGSSGHTGAPLAERRLAIVKLASLKTHASIQRSGQNLRPLQLLRPNRLQQQKLQRNLPPKTLHKTKNLR